MTNRRAEFRTTFLDLRLVEDQLRGLHDPDCPVQKDYREAQEAAWRKFRRTARGAPSKLPKDPSRIHELADLTDAVAGAVKTDAAVLRASLTRRQSDLKGRLDHLASRLLPHAGASRMVLHTSWSSTYSSQGFGAETYARNAAEMHADLARYHNVPVEVVRVNPRRGSHGISHADYQVVVSVTDWTDLEVLRRLDGPTLVESVRLCWKRGVNPRVFNPFLPHDFEAKNGLDYFGGTLKPTGAEA